MIRGARRTTARLMLAAILVAPLVVLGLVADARAVGAVAELICETPCGPALVGDAP